MLQIDANNTIHLTRGDTAYFEIAIKDSNNQTYTVQDGDVITFTVKKSTYDKDSILKKTALDSVVKFEPADTSALPYATYYYDVELKTANGDVFTVIPPAKFILSEEVSW